MDDEGYEIVSDDDDERVEDAELAAAELNPYSNIRLERKSGAHHRTVTPLTVCRSLGPLDQPYRSAPSPDPIKTARLQDPHGTHRAKLRHDAERKPIIVASQTPVDLSLRRRGLDAM